MRFLIALSIPAALCAQSTATIYGNAADNSGAVMPGVTVVISHQETGLTRQVATGADGAYVAVNLPIGTFSLRAQSAGFKEYVQCCTRTTSTSIAPYVKLACGRMANRSRHAPICGTANPR